MQMPLRGPQLWGCCLHKELLQQPSQTTGGKEGVKQGQSPPHRPKPHPQGTFKSVVNCSTVRLGVSLVRECLLLVTDDSFLNLTRDLGFQVAMEKGCPVSMETNPFA